MINKIKDFLLYFVMFVVVTFSVVIILQFTDLESLFKPDLTELGLNGIGDFLSGYLGVFISLMTLLLVFFTYNSQKTELALQREELDRQKVVLESQLQETKYSRILNSVYIELDVLSKVIEEFIRKSNEIKFEPAKFATTYVNLIQLKLSLESQNDHIIQFQIRNKYIEYFYRIYDNEGYELCLKIQDCCFNLDYLTNSSNEKETLNTIIANRIGVSFFYIATESIEIIKLLDQENSNSRLNVVLNCLKTVKVYRQYSLRAIDEPEA